MRYSIIWLAAVLMALGLHGINASIDHAHFTKNLIPRLEVFKSKSPAEIIPETEEITRSNTETESNPPPQQEITEACDTSHPGLCTDWDSVELKASREYRNVNHGGYNADEGIIVVDDVEAANDNLASSNPKRDMVADCRN
ncbi:hypothetical protein BofuT4_P023270.1 [Botrytis cinerea T4]|uniref:Uncharacterized protein n=1 Tax=Botryotinia fuckeliana (strain T4) TaxID=999810 RepID=G2YH25_BOTF4|nr:hypothetical protein BofuT4_P023270.1 [Botrytis cinerea T4]